MLTLFSLHIAVLPVLSALVTALLAFLAWRRRHIPGAGALAFLMLAFTTWTITLVMGTPVTTLAQAKLWDRMSYVGMEAVPLAWMVFACHYAGNDRWLTPRVIALLALPLALVLVLVWTNDLHLLIYRQVWLQPNVPRAVLAADHGPAYWGNLAYLYVLLMVGVGVLARAFQRSSPLYRGQVALVFVALLFPWVASVLDVFNLNRWVPYSDLAPLAAPVSGLLVLWSMLRFKFLAIPPIARHLVIETMRDGVLVLDTAGLVVDANPATLRMMAAPARAVIGRPLAQAWPPLAEALAGMATPSPDGLTTTLGARWYNLRVSPLANWREETLGQLLLLRDVTALRQAERERETLTEQLRQAQKMEAIGLLAGGVAHDLNNLLSPIIGYAELAQMQAGDNARLMRQLTHILDAATRASSFTRQLLAFSRKQVLSLKPTNLTAVARDFLPMLQRLVGEPVTLIAAFDPQVATVQADAGQLQQVLMNLVLNARDALPGGGEIHITLANDPAAGTVVLTVRDAGVGMDAHTQEHLFEPFFTTKAPGKGTGLGMATVFGIVQQHHGRVEVDSAPGRGTTVCITLPALASVESDPPAATPGGAVHSPTTAILLAEDDADVRMLVHDVLHSHGYQVLATANGAEALRAAQAYGDAIPLLITDVMMPEMNGGDLARHLTSVTPGMKVLFMSGYPDDVLASHDIDNRTTHFLAKPFSIHQLLEKVNDVLAQR